MKIFRTQICRCLTVMILGLISLQLHAGESESRLMLGSGIFYENGWDATLAIESEGAYHNAWEYFINGFLNWRKCPSCGHICRKSLFNNYRTWEIGAAYKPCLGRSRNQHSHARIGAGVGSDSHKVIVGVTVGYEHDYCLKGGWQLYWQARTEFVICAREHWRTGISVGVKMPW